MPEGNGNHLSRLTGAGRFLVAFAAAIAAVVLFAWASQSSQDEAIRDNRTAIELFKVELRHQAEALTRIEKKLGTWPAEGRGSP